MAGLLSGLHDLADKTLRALDAAVAGPDAAGSDPDLVIATGHCRVQFDR
jgi:hypothetical protein